MAASTRVFYSCVIYRSIDVHMGETTYNGSPIYTQGTDYQRKKETTESMAREEQRSTLVRPPPADPDKAPIENVLDVTEVGVLGTVSQ